MSGDRQQSSCWIRCADPDACSLCTNQLLDGYGSQVERRLNTSFKLLDRQAEKCERQISETHELQKHQQVVIRAAWLLREWFMIHRRKKQLTWHERCISTALPLFTHRFAALVLHATCIERMLMKRRHDIRLFGGSHWLGLEWSKEKQLRLWFYNLFSDLLFFSFLSCFQIKSSIVQQQRSTRQRTQGHDICKCLTIDFLFRFTCLFRAPSVLLTLFVFGVILILLFTSFSSSWFGEKGMFVHHHHFPIASVSPLQPPSLSCSLLPMQRRPSSSSPNYITVTAAQVITWLLFLYSKVTFLLPLRRRRWRLKSLILQSFHLLNNHHFPFFHVFLSHHLICRFSTPFLSNFLPVPCPSLA